MSPVAFPFIDFNDASVVPEFGSLGQGQVKTKCLWAFDGAQLIEELDAV